MVVTGSQGPVTAVLREALPLSLFLLQWASSGISSITRQPDGKLISVGTDNNNGLVFRLNENGSLDTSFAAGGVHRPNIDQISNDRVTNSVVQPDGKIVIMGVTGDNTTSRRLFLLRYEANGLLDPSFGDGGFIVHNLLNPYGELLLQSNGKFLTSSRDSNLDAATL